MPLKKRDRDFDAVRGLAREIAGELVKDDPAHRTLETSKAKREGRLYVDINRNAYTQNVAPAFAVRARPGAPVSVPIDWSELGRRTLKPDQWNIRNVFKWLDSHGDPWSDF